MYRPLPDYLKILNSPIEGSGLFTIEDLPSNLEIGITHVQDGRFADDYIRTPLGGFFNHSEDPNCEAYVVDDLIRLRTVKQIAAGEELTVRYWLRSYTVNPLSEMVTE